STLLALPPISPLFPYTTLFRSPSSDFRDFDTQIAYASTPAAITPTITRSTVSAACETTSGAISRATRFITLMSGFKAGPAVSLRSEEHTSELQSRFDLVCRLLL